MLLCWSTGLALHFETLMAPVLWIVYFRDSPDITLNLIFQYILRGKEQELQWADEHIRWTCMFETSSFHRWIPFSSLSCRWYVRRPVGEHLADVNIVRWVTRDFVGVMVQGDIRHGHHTQLDIIQWIKNVVWYQDAVLQLIAVSFCRPSGRHIWWKCIAFRWIFLGDFQRR